MGTCISVNTDISACGKRHSGPTRLMCQHAASCVTPTSASAQPQEPAEASVWTYVLACFTCELRLSSYCICAAISACENASEWTYALATDPCGHARGGGARFGIRVDVPVVEAHTLVDLRVWLRVRLRVRVVVQHAAGKGHLHQRQHSH